MVVDVGKGGWMCDATTRVVVRSSRVVCFLLLVVVQLLPVYRDAYIITCVCMCHMRVFIEPMLMVISY